MSERQKEASSNCLTGRAYKCLSEIYEQLPDRFYFHDVLRLMRLPKNHPQRYAVKHSLVNVFKCVDVTGSIFKKPRKAND